MRIAQDGQRVEILVADGKTWISPLDAATAQALGAPPEVVGKYVEVPAAQAADFKDISLQAILKEFTSPEGMSVLQKANIELTDVTEGGRPARRLKERVSTDNAEVVIASDGKPDILRFTSPKDGTVQFTRWDAATTFTAPPADKIHTQ